MASQSFTLLNNQVLSLPGITSNGVYDLYTSATQNNNNNLPSIRMVIDYHQLNPVDIYSSGIGVVVEALNGGKWFPAAYQFEPYRNSENGNQRLIFLQPDISTYDDGIDSIVYVGDRTIARISRQQGRIGSSFRVRVILSENNYGTANAFQNVTMSIYGELYDV